jgi:hypothetical protein
MRQGAMLTVCALDRPPPGVYPPRPDSAAGGEDGAQTPSDGILGDLWGYVLYAGIDQLSRFHSHAAAR